MHERGMADDELIDEHERDRFAGVAGPDRPADATATATRSTTAPARRPTATADEPDRRPASDGASGTTDDRDAATTGATTGEPQTEYEQGREDERRFERDRITDDVRESERRAASSEHRLQRRRRVRLGGARCRASRRAVAASAVSGARQVEALRELAAEHAQLLQVRGASRRPRRRPPSRGCARARRSP